MNDKKIKLLGAALLLAAGAHAQAGVVFSDNFNGNAVNFLGGLNQTPSGWRVAAGSVDLVGAGTMTPLQGNGWPAHAIGAGHGRFVDLDGSSFDAGILSHELDLLAGTTYTLAFELAGKHRLLGGASDTVTVNFGSAQLSATLGANAGWAGYSLQFTPTQSQRYSFSFANAGGDNYGALLDNVSVSASVPEPQSYALMGTGLLAMLWVSRRRLARR